MIVSFALGSNGMVLISIIKHVKTKNNNILSLPILSQIQFTG